MNTNPMWKTALLIGLGIPASALLAGCSAGPVPLGSESEAVAGGHRPGSSSGGSGSSSGSSSSGGTGATNGEADASTEPVASTGVWTQRFAPTPLQGWVALASNSTGADLVAIASLGDIWTSTNAGLDWTNRTASTAASGMNWTAVASDSTGANLVAVSTPEGVYLADGGIAETGGGIWTSTDSGAHWTNRTAGTSASTENWYSVASDATGTHLVAVSEADVWTSANAGATWTNETTGTVASGQSWSAVASDASGTHLVAVSKAVEGSGPTGVAEGDLWMSANAGATWTNRTAGTSATGQIWTSVASDSSGVHLVGVVNGGGIWTSTDSGLTWTNRTAGTSVGGPGTGAAGDSLWYSVASDSTGTYLVAAEVETGYDDIWTSSNGGATWTNQTAATSPSGQQWSSVASDSTGAHLAASSAAGLWTN